MVLIQAALAVSALLLGAAAEPPPPPAALAPYIEDGRLAPVDYAWIEGSSADAPLHCVDGQRRLLPVEDDLAVDRLRGEAGMEAVAAYIAEMNRVLGPC